MAYYDVAIVVSDHVGALAEIGEAFGKAGINIEGFWTHTRDGDAHIHVLVDNRDRAEEVVRGAGWTVHRAHEVLVAPLENRPGWGGQQFRKLAEAGLNVEWAYIATDNRIVVSCKDLDKARQVWQGAGVASN